MNQKKKIIEILLLKVLPCLIGSQYELMPASAVEVNKKKKKKKGSSYQDNWPLYFL